MNDALLKHSGKSLPSAEQVLILLSARTRLNFDQSSRVKTILMQRLDWDGLFSSAHRNGVLALVCNTLFENFSNELSDDVTSRLEEFRRSHLNRNIQLSARLIEVIQLLNSAGISCTPFKGPLLAQRAYNSLALRQFVDLDILVKPDDLERSSEVLQKAGYRAGDTPSKVHRLAINRKKDISLFRPDENVRVELHWKLSGSYFPIPIRLDELWNRLETVRFGGISMLSLPFTDLFVYLCLHAARHGFERLEWLCDLNELIRSERDVDWESVFALAKEMGCERTVEFALHLLNEHLETNIDCSRSSFIEEPMIGLATRRIREKWFAGISTPDGVWDWYLYHLMLREKRRDRFKLHLFYIYWYLKLIFRPNSMDRSSFPLPATLYPLYYVLRPARLLLNAHRRHTG